MGPEAGRRPSCLSIAGSGLGPWKNWLGSTVSSPEIRASMHRSLCNNLVYSTIMLLVPYRRMRSARTMVLVRYNIVA